MSAFQLRHIAQPIAVATFAFLAFAFLAIGVWSIASLGLTEIYADQWRQYPVFIDRAFPQNVLASDNGHRTVFTALIRLIRLIELT